jgi:hypothetical protein
MFWVTALISCVAFVAADLPDFENYATFAGVSLADDGSASWYWPMAPMKPDPVTGIVAGRGEDGRYESTAHLGIYYNDSAFAERICDLYGDRCQWYTWTSGSPSIESETRIGVWARNETVNTYLNISKGLHHEKYLWINPSFAFCDPYVGWNEPADVIKKECDNDPKCNGFIMRTDNSGGHLCTYVGGNAMAFFKIPK